ncbi:hypothetical protein ACWY4P_30990 [Streptomyces sp. LZ34]
MQSVGVRDLELLDTARAWAKGYLDELIDAREAASRAGRTS